MGIVIEATMKGGRIEALKITEVKSGVETVTVNGSVDFGLDGSY